MRPTKGRLQVRVPRRLMAGVFNLPHDLDISGGCFDPVKDEFIFIVEGDRLPVVEDHNAPPAVPITQSWGKYTVDLSFLEEREEEDLTPDEIKAGIAQAVYDMIGNSSITDAADYVVYVPVIEDYEWPEHFTTPAGPIEICPHPSITTRTFYVTARKQNK